MRNLTLSLFAPALLFYLAAAGCTRVNMLYCDSTYPCGMGMVCVMPQHECQPGAGDMRPGMPDLANPPPDLRMADGGFVCTSDSQCAALSAKLPACIAGACQPCRRNFQCPDSACDDNGTCHDPAVVIHVNDGAGCGGAGNPFCNVQDAMAAVGPGKNVVLLDPSKGEGITKAGSPINISKSVRIIGKRASVAAPLVVLLDPISIATPMTPIAVGIEDLEVSPRNSGSTLGIFCVQSDQGIAFTLRWSKVDQAHGGGIGIQSCSPVVMISNQIVNNRGILASYGGVLISTQDLTLLNNVIANNLGSGLDTLAAGLSLPTTPAATQIAFNTVVNNDCATPPCNLKCGQSLNMSYMIAQKDGTVGANCNLSRSVVPVDVNGGTMNIKIMPDFVDPTQFDYHPQVTAKNQMLLLMDDKPVVGYDLDDNPRPGKGGVAIGAYQLP